MALASTGKRRRAFSVLSPFPLFRSFSPVFARTRRVLPGYVPLARAQARTASRSSSDKWKLAAGA